MVFPQIGGNIAHVFDTGYIRSNFENIRNNAPAVRHVFGNLGINPDKLSFLRNLFHRNSSGAQTAAEIQHVDIHAQDRIEKEQQIKEAAAELSSAYNTDRGKYDEIAREYQKVNQDLFDNAAIISDKAERTEALQFALKMTMHLHQKPDKIDNTLSLANTFLSDPEVLKQLGGEYVKQPALEAANWMYLGERYAPLRLFAAPCTLMDHESMLYVKPLFNDAATLYHQNELGSKQIKKLISQIRHTGAPRSPIAQFLDVMDQMERLAKPDFREGKKPDGALKIDVIFDLIKENIAKEKDHIDGELFSALRNAAKNGLYEKALVKPKQDDVYVR